MRRRRFEHVIEAVTRDGCRAAHEGQIGIDLTDDRNRRATLSPRLDVVLEIERDIRIRR